MVFVTEVFRIEDLGEIVLSILVLLVRIVESTDIIVVFVGVNNYPYYNQQTFSQTPVQPQQSLPSPAHSLLPALPAPSVQSAITMPNNNHNYARPITAIQSVSAEADPSFQVQARDEEIELLHVQIERLQHLNFPEFIAVNSSVTVPSSCSLGAACE